jgi:hypothetical protein
MNKRLVYFCRPGISLYKPITYDEHVIFPISKITEIVQVCRCVKIILDNQTVVSNDYDNEEDAKRQFNELTKCMLEELR